MSVKARIYLERTIVEKAIDALLAAGYGVGVYDGEETHVPNSHDASILKAAIMHTDEDYLFVYEHGRDLSADKDKRPDSWVRCTYGNDGWDVISDYTTDLETVLEPVNAFVESLS